MSVSMPIVSNARLGQSRYLVAEADIAIVSF